MNTTTPMFHLMVACSILWLLSHMESGQDISLVHNINANADIDADADTGIQMNPIPALASVSTSRMPPASRRCR